MAIMFWPNGNPLANIGPLVPGPHGILDRAGPFGESLDLRTVEPGNVLLMLFSRDSCGARNRLQMRARILYPALGMADPAVASIETAYGPRTSHLIGACSPRSSGFDPYLVHGIITRGRHLKWIVGGEISCMNVSPFPMTHWELYAR
jgi:hypothetical protein